MIASNMTNNNASWVLIASRYMDCTSQICQCGSKSKNSSLCLTMIRFWKIWECGMYQIVMKTDAQGLSFDWVGCLAMPNWKLKILWIKMCNTISNLKECLKKHTKLAFSLTFESSKWETFFQIFWKISSFGISKEKSRDLFLSFAKLVMFSPK